MGGLHFYTLNLEKIVIGALLGLGLVTAEQAAACSAGEADAKSMVSAQGITSRISGRCGVMAPSLVPRLHPHSPRLRLVRRPQEVQFHVSSVYGRVWRGYTFRFAFGMRNFIELSSRG